MIYEVKKAGTAGVYFDDSTNPNAKAEAEALLAKLRADELVTEAVRFSICAIFVNGNDHTWRELQETDPEDTICQVFDHMTGLYTQCANKTEAHTLNEQKKQEFLTMQNLHKVSELLEMPKRLAEYPESTFGKTVGGIPVEVM